MSLHRIERTRKPTLVLRKERANEKTEERSSEGGRESLGSPVAPLFLSLSRFSDEGTFIKTSPMTNKDFYISNTTNARLPPVRRFPLSPPTDAPSSQIPRLSLTPAGASIASLSLSLSLSLSSRVLFASSPTKPYLRPPRVLLAGLGFTSVSVTACKKMLF